MVYRDINTVEDSLKLLRAHAYNESKTNYKVTIGLNFSKSKVATKKRAKIEDSYLAELSKDPIFFPHQFGKAPTVALFTLKKLDMIPGIDYIGSENLIKDILNSTVEPNYLITFKDEMPLLNKHSRVLGPRGLMPTPKQGTIVEEENITRVVDSLKKGSFKLKLDKSLAAHIPVGYLNMDDSMLHTNIDTLLSFVRTHLPASFVKTNLKNIYITTTQGPCTSLIL